MASTSAYFAPLVTLPDVITEPGTYRTRAGELVSVVSVSKRHDLGCVGFYPEGTQEHWHKIGRIFATITSWNDIVGKGE
nr:hypothetical protein [uncultured Gellertiella sp.]